MPGLPQEWDLHGYLPTLGAERALLRHRDRITPAVLEAIKETSRKHGDVEQGNFLILERHVINTLSKLFGTEAV